MSRYFQFLKDNSASMIGDIERFVSLETPSTDKPLLDEFARFLADYARTATGGEADIVPAEHSGNNVILRCGDRGRGRPLLLVGHYDTVWPAGTLREMPFSVEGNIARGPGIFDMKAGLVQGFWAIRALRETGGSDRPLVFVCNSDEEIGSPGSRELIEREARAASAVLVLEPNFNGAVKTARKGVGRYTVSVEGRAAHAGLDPRAGVSAIDEIARLVTRLHGYTDMERGTTVNVGVVQGGTRFNVVAAAASAEVDLRVATATEAQRMHGEIRALKAHHPEAHVRIEGGLVWPPMERNAKIGELYATARRVAKEALDLDLGEAAVGGASDGCTCAALGVPVLDGLGASGAGAHAVDEHIELADVPLRAALVAHLLEALDT